MKRVYVLSGEEIAAIRAACMTIRSCLQEMKPSYFTEEIDRQVDRILEEGLGMEVRS